MAGAGESDPSNLADIQNGLFTEIRKFWEVASTLYSLKEEATASISSAGSGATSLPSTSSGSPRSRMLLSRELPNILEAIIRIKPLMESIYIAANKINTDPGATSLPSTTSKCPNKRYLIEICDSLLAAVPIVVYVESLEASIANPGVTVFHFRSESQTSRSPSNAIPDDEVQVIKILKPISEREHTVYDLTSDAEE